MIAEAIEAADQVSEVIDHDLVVINQDSAASQDLKNLMIETLDQDEEETINQCFQQIVQNVENHAKFHFVQTEKSPCSAIIVFQRKKKPNHMDLGIDSKNVIRSAHQSQIIE